MFPEVKLHPGNLKNLPLCPHVTVIYSVIWGHSQSPWHHRLLTARTAIPTWNSGALDKMGHTEVMEDYGHSNHTQTHFLPECQVLGSHREPSLPLGSSCRFWCECCWQLQPLKGTQLGLKCGFAFVGHHPQVRAIQRHPQALFPSETHHFCKQSNTTAAKTVFMAQTTRGFNLEKFGKWLSPRLGAWSWEGRRMVLLTLALLVLGSPSHKNPELLWVGFKCHRTLP